MDEGRKEVYKKRDQIYENDKREEDSGRPKEKRGGTRSTKEQRGKREKPGERQRKKIRDGEKDQKVACVGA